MKEFAVGAEWFVKNLGTDVPAFLALFAGIFAQERRRREWRARNGPRNCDKTGVKYAYTGNNPVRKATTPTARCGKKVVERLGFKVLRSFLSAENVRTAVIRFLASGWTTCPMATSDIGE
jgi:hypothetical protein